jgi:hypothetical protein
MNKKIIRKFGYLKDQDGIMNRYLREAEGWATHLNNTKDFIVNSASEKGKFKAVIMGSGWLLDVPFSELSQIFKEVILVDIKHPVQIVHKLKDYPNIKFIETDITGLVEPVFQTLKKNIKNKEIISLTAIIPQYDLAFFNEILQADFVVSVNLLNQLDILLCDYILLSKQFNDNEIKAFRKYVQTKHLELLPKGKSVLITDYEELNIDDKHQIINRKQLLYVDLSPHIIRSKWTWDFDSQKTYHKNLQTVFKVMAVEV